jgi:hypothetical protein
MPWAGFLLYIDATPVYRGQIVQDNKPFRPINRSIPPETGAWRPFPAVQDYELQTVLPGLLSAETHSRRAPGPVQDPEPPGLSLYLWTLRTFTWCCLVQGHAWASGADAEEQFWFVCELGKSHASNFQVGIRVSILSYEFFTSSNAGICLQTIKPRRSRFIL